MMCQRIHGCPVVADAGIRVLDPSQERTALQEAPTPARWTAPGPLLCIKIEKLVANSTRFEWGPIFIFRHPTQDDCPSLPAISLSLFPPSPPPSDKGI